MSLLEDKEIIEWCSNGCTKITLKDTSTEKKLKEYKKTEKEWGNNKLKKYFNYPKEKNIVNWTTKLSEELVKETLIKLGYKNIKNAKSIESTIKKRSIN